MSKIKASQEESHPKKEKTWWQRGLKIIWRIFQVIVVILILLLLFIRSPWGQNIIIGEATKFVSKKTNTEVNIDKLFVTFSGKVNLQGLYLEDKQGDTLIYSKELEAAIPLIPILKGEPISLNRLTWTGLKANVYRKDSIAGYNFQFLIDAFAGDSAESKPEQTKSEDQKLPEIYVGSIDFSDFDLTFDDEVLGIDAKLDLGHLKFRGKNIDLNEMDFEARQLHLENTSINYTQTKPFAESEDTTATTLPFFRLDELKLANVKANYKSIPDNMEAEMDLHDFLIEVPKADLAKQEVEVNQLNFHQSNIMVKMGKASEADRKAEELGEDVQDEVEEAFVFEWPDWNVKVRSIDFADNNLLYQVGEKPTKNKGFNSDYIDLRDFTLAIEDLELTSDEHLAAIFDKLSFREDHSNLALKQLHFDLDLNKTKLDLQDFILETDKNKINAELALNYTSINDLIEHPDQSDFDIDLSDFLIDLKEVFLIAPDLKTNEYVAKLSRNTVKGKIKAKGSLANVDLPLVNVRWGNTRINARGKLKNLTNPDQLFAGIDDFRLHTNRQEVLVFVDEEEIGISVPETIYLQSQLYGSLDDLKTKTLLQIPEGEINVDGSFKNKELIAFDAVLDVSDFDLGKILNNPNIGKIELNLKSQGEGSSIENLTGTIDTQFSKLEFNDYDFSALKIKGNLTEGDGNIILSYLDDNLDMLLASTIHMDSLGQKIGLDLNIEEADLQKLKLYDKEINTNISLFADLENSDGTFSVESHLVDGNIYYDNKTYLLGALNLGGEIRKDSTFFALNSKILSGQLAANAKPDEVTHAIERQLKRYFRDSIAQIDTLRKPISVDVDMSVTPHPLLTEVLVPGIVEMDTLELKANFDQSKDILYSNVSLNYLNFENNIINDLYFDITSEADVAQFVLGFENLEAGSFGMYRTFLTGDLTDGLLTANFFSFNENEEIFFAFHSETSGSRKNIKFHLLPYNLILNNETWTIPEDNEIAIGEKDIKAKNFVLSNEQREFRIANDLIETKSDNIGIGFKDFQLETLLALFNPEKHLAEGNLQGKIVAVNPLDKIGVLADFGIEELQVFRTPLGDLSLKAFAKDLNQYRFKMDLNGDDVDMGATGNFISGDESTFELDFKVDRLGMETIAGLSQNELTEGSGYLSGEIMAKGNVKSPKYDGHLKFNEASFKVSQLNTKFTLDEDALDINEQGLTFNNFTIQDENNSELSIDGAITTKTLTRPKLNLKLNTKNFQVMNSTEEDNELFYGKLNLDLDGTLKGSFSSPDIDLNININKETDFTYALSAAQTAKESQEGVVEFVNRDAPIYVLENQKKDSINSSKITGMNLHANLNIDKGAKLGVVVDPRTNDNLEISGSGALDFRMNPNGQMNLSGRYTIDEGYYKLSLYNLVKRQFNFKSGSSITWAGDIMDADLDVTAIYSVKTSPAGLMSGSSSGMSEEDRNRYKQKLPFLVYLNVGGSIDKPDLSFGLDMEEEAKGAMDGSVYSQVQQMKGDEGEINKQVFSLLVLNRFFPRGSDGSGGGFASMARDNLNQALTDQLNNFSDQFTGDSGFKLSFGLDSYEAYSGGSSQQRTDLDITAEQRLFNDRLVVKAGTEMNVQGDLQPGEEKPLLGNVSIEYLITEDGRWRLRGFRKNEYENVIDGQVFTNGIGVLFQRDFNRFRYLWRSLFHNPEKYWAEQRKKREKKEEEEENKNGIEKEAVKDKKEDDQSKNDAD